MKREDLENKYNLIDYTSKGFTCLYDKDPNAISYNLRAMPFIASIKIIEKGQPNFRVEFNNEVYSNIDDLENAINEYNSSLELHPSLFDPSQFALYRTEGIIKYYLEEKLGCKFNPNELIRDTDTKQWYIDSPFKDGAMVAAISVRFNGKGADYNADCTVGEVRMHFGNSQYYKMGFDNYTEALGAINQLLDILTASMATKMLNIRAAMNESFRNSKSVICMDNTTPKYPVISNAFHRVYEQLDRLMIEFKRKYAVY